MTALGFLAEPLAIVRPSDGADPSVVATASRRLMAKHGPGLTAGDRRRLAVALDLGRGSSHWRAGHRVRGGLYALRAFLRLPVGNRALADLMRRKCHG